MIDKLFFVILILNATGLFAFIAPQFGVEISVISITLLGLNGVYLVTRWRYLISLFRQKDMIYWLFLMLIWPLFTIMYTPVLEVRQIGLQCYYVSLFCGAVVYTMANGLPAIHRVMTISLAITMLGLLLSYIVPEYFMVVSVLADAQFEEEGRASGFLLQPNQLAICMNLMFIGWFSLWKGKNTWLELAVIIMFLLIVLLTGSRTGILLAVIVVMLILSYSWRKRLISWKYLLKMGTLIVCIAIGIIGIRYSLSHVEYTNLHTADLINRMETMVNFKLSDNSGIKDDTSVRDRTFAQEFYWSLFNKKPLLGHGFGSDVYYREEGLMYKSAHSYALTSAMEYGVFYPLAFILLLLRLYFKRNRSDVEGIFQTNTIGQFVAIMIPLFVIASILDTRTLYVVWGMFFAAVCCPQYIFNYGDRKS